MPSYVIGLDIGHSSVKAAVLKGSLRGYEIEDFLSLDAASPGDTTEMPSPAADRVDTSGEVAPVSLEKEDGPPDDEEDPGLPSLLSEPQLEATRKVLAAISHPQALVICSIPAERVSSWFVELPFSDRKRIDQTVGFELENYVPWDMDDVVLDYEILESDADGSIVFAAMVPRPLVVELLGQLRALDADPRHLGVDAAELARLVPPGEQLDVVVDIGSTRTLVCAAFEGRARWIRSLDVGSDVFAEEDGLQDWVRKVRASLIAAEESVGRGVESVLLCGGGSKLEGLAETLEEELGVEVGPLELPPSEINPDMAPRPEPEHALCYALALKGFAGKDEVGVTLRRGEFAWKADSRLYTRLAFAAVAALLLLGVGFVVLHFLELQKLDSRLEAANEHLTSTVQGTFPNVSPAALMTPDGSIAVMQEQVLALRGRVSALEGHTQTPLELLRDLHDTIPDSIVVDIDEFLANDDMIRIRGTTDSFNSVDRLMAAVEANPRFKGATKSDVNKARDGKMRFVVTIPREPLEGLEG